MCCRLAMYRVGIHPRRDGHARHESREEGKVREMCGVLNGTTVLWGLNAE